MQLNTSPQKLGNISEYTPKVIFPNFQNFMSTTISLPLKSYQDKGPFWGCYRKKKHVSLFIKSYRRTLKSEKQMQ